MIVKVNGLNINFQVHGKGEPVVLLHGWGDSSVSWSEVLARLSEQFQVFVIDLPGFGASDKPETAWDIDDYAECLKGFISEMEINDPLLFGHSHGGKICAHYVAKGNPCKGLMLFSASGVDRPSLKVKAKIKFFKSLKFIFSFMGASGEKLTDWARGYFGSRDYREAGPMRETMVKVVNYKLFDELAQIKVPTVIFWGSEDSTLSISQAKIYRKLIEGSYIKVLWGGTHFAHLEQPDVLVSYVQDFGESL